MKLKRLILLIITHGIAAMIGFAAGVYTLPILTAPPAPAESMIQKTSEEALYSGQFKKDLTDSDGFHWGEGKVSVDPKFISFMGELAPGPDYKLYLSPQFVDTETEFNRLKSTMIKIADIKTFNGFIVDVPKEVDVSRFNTVVIWCESFGQFITAAKYR